MEFYKPCFILTCCIQKTAKNKTKQKTVFLLKLCDFVNDYMILILY